MEDSSERSLLLLFLLLLHHFLLFSRSNLRLFRFRRRPLSLFSCRAWTLTLHCSFSLLNLARPSSSRAPICPLFLSPLLSRSRSRSRSRSPARRASHSTDSRDRRSLQSMPSCHACWSGILSRLRGSSLTVSRRVPFASLVRSLVFRETKTVAKRRVVR